MSKLGCGEYVTYKHVLYGIPTFSTIILGVMWVVLQTHAASPHPGAATQAELESHQESTHQGAATHEQISILANVLQEIKKDLDEDIKELRKDTRQIRDILLRSSRQMRGKPVLQLPDRNR